jgi:hypothetical protein
VAETLEEAKPDGESVALRGAPSELSAIVFVYPYWPPFALPLPMLCRILVALLNIFAMRRL